MIINTEYGAENITCEKLCEKINDWDAKIVKIIRIPNAPRVLRVVVDDCIFMGYFVVSDVDDEDIISLIRGIDCEYVLYMVDEHWKDMSYWETSRFVFEHYFKYDHSADDYWNGESAEFRAKIGRQYDAWLSTKYFKDLIDLLENYMWFDDFNEDIIKFFFGNPISACELNDDGNQIFIRYELDGFEELPVCFDMDDEDTIVDGGVFRFFIYIDGDECVDILDDKGEFIGYLRLNLL